MSPSRNLVILILTVAALFSAILPASAQTALAADDEKSAGSEANLAVVLGLTPEQIDQLKEAKRMHRPRLQAAIKRMRDANRALDAAVYADNVDDSDFRTRLADYQTAQAEVARLRFEGELAVRRILTRQQLLQFRELRRQFAESRRQMKKANDPGAVRPRKALRQLRRRANKP